jgi:hypothetical protein
MVHIIGTHLIDARKEIPVEQGPNILGSKPAKLAIRTGLSIVGLLLLRGIVGSLPILKNSSAMGESFLGDSLLSPLVIANVVIDTVILLVILTFGLRMGHYIQTHGERFSDLGRIANQSTLLAVLIFAYKVYELPAACFFVGRTDLVNLSSNSAQGPYGDFVRVWGQLINQANATAIQNASGEALNAYQQLALAIFRRPPNYYAWTFLILIAIPVIGLVPLVHRNLDAMAELLSHGAAALQGNAGAFQPGAAKPASSNAKQESINAAEALTLRQIVEKLATMKTLLDSGAISSLDFQNQKQRILGLPVNFSPSSAGAEDFLRLKALLDSGALTEEEYEAQKQRALQQI